jgi:hypothetical protein
VRPSARLGAPQDLEREAFLVPAHDSQNHNRKLYDIALTVCETGEIPGSRTR